MKDVRNWMLRILLKAIILIPVAIVGLYIYDIVSDDIRYKKEAKERINKWKTEGISPVTRGSNCDTVKIK